MKKNYLLVLLFIILIPSIVSADTINVDEWRHFYRVKNGDKVCYNDNIAYFISRGTTIGLARLSGTKYSLLKYVTLDNDKCFDVNFESVLKSEKLGNPDYYIISTYHNTKNLGDTQIIPIYGLRFNVSCDDDELKYGKSTLCNLSYLNPPVLDVNAIKLYDTDGSGSYYYKRDFDTTYLNINKILFDIVADGFEISDVSAPLNTKGGNQKYIFEEDLNNTGVITTFKITSTNKNKIGTASNISIDNLMVEYEDNPLFNTVEFPELTSGVEIIENEEIKGEEITNPETGVETTNIILILLAIIGLMMAYFAFSKNNFFKNFN